MEQGRNIFDETQCRVTFLNTTFFHASFSQITSLDLTTLWCNHTIYFCYMIFFAFSS